MLPGDNNKHRVKWETVSYFLIVQLQLIFIFRSITAYLKFTEAESAEISFWKNANPLFTSTPTL